MPLFIAGAMVLGTGAGALASSSASKKAAAASQAATDSSAAVQNRALDLQQSNTATARAVGDQSLNTLASRLGLGGAGGGAAPTGGAGTPAGGGAAAPTFNGRAYMEAFPDVAQEYAKVNGPGLAQALGLSNDPQANLTEDQFAAWHAQQSGRQVPQAAPVQAAFNPGDPQAPAENPPLISRGTVDDQGAYVPPRPAVGAAPVYQAPTYRETAIAPLDVGLDKYEQSPDYEFQRSEGNRNILANASATGGLESGAALKSLQKFGQDLAMGDYGQWRDYTTGQYNQDRNFTANRDDAANAFSGAQAQNVFNAANGSYQYQNTLAQGNYNNDRDYASNRYDTRTNNLLSLAGYGANATGQSNSALGQNASALSNSYLANANNQGNAALAGAGQTNNAISSGVNALAYYYGNKPAAGSDPSMKGLY